MLYRLQPEARDQALDIVTNLSETLKDRTHKVRHLYSSGDLFYSCIDVMVSSLCLQGVPPMAT